MKRQKLLLTNLFTVCALAMLPAAAMAQDEVASVATFDETTLPAESYWFGDGEPADMYAGEIYDFYSGRYMFTGMKHSCSWWNGYALSNETATEYTDLSHQFRSAAGGAHSGANYAVYYYDSWDVVSRIYNVYDEAGAPISGMYVTNAAYALNSILNGDDYGSTPFATGDYFKLIVKGYDINDEETGTVEFYLADYRSENEAERRYTSLSRLRRAIRGVLSHRSMCASTTSMVSTPILAFRSTPSRPTPGFQPQARA